MTKNIDYFLRKCKKFNMIVINSEMMFFLMK